MNYIYYTAYITPFSIVASLIKTKYEKNLSVISILGQFENN